MNDVAQERMSCTCLDYVASHHYCKHLYAVLKYRDVGAPPTTASDEQLGASLAARAVLFCVLLLALFKCSFKKL